MNCHEFESIVVDLARGEVSDSTLGTRCWAHAANCPRCNDRLLEEEKLNAGFQALSTLGDERPAQAASEDVLRREFRKQFAGVRKQTERRPLTHQIPGRVPIRKFSWAWVAIAAALLAPVVVILAERWQTGTVPPAVAKANKSSTAATQATENKSDVRAIPSAQQRPYAVGSSSPSKVRGSVKGRKKPSTPSRPVNWSNPSDEVATDFIPLPYGSGLSLDDGWQIVRVSMPRSELASLGVSFGNEQTSAGTVKADLVLGEDGLARAIRFVD